jgi:hypothetical protein
MTRWRKGEAEVELLLARGDLQLVAAAQANSLPLLQKANKTAETAASLVERDPDSAFVLAYDAARCACTALLAQQDIRATSAGGHYAVERAVRAQFGDGFRGFADLRRRRNELEYPRLVADVATSDEASHAVREARRIIDIADRLISELAPFR